MVKTHQTSASLLAARTWPYNTTTAIDRIVAFAFYFAVAFVTKSIAIENEIVSDHEIRVPRPPNRHLCLRCLSRTSRGEAKMRNQGTKFAKNKPLLFEKFRHLVARKVLACVLEKFLAMITLQALIASNASNLLTLLIFYFSFQPICKKCGVRTCVVEYYCILVSNESDFSSSTLAHICDIFAPIFFPLWFMRPFSSQCYRFHCLGSKYVKRRRFRKWRRNINFHHL